MYRKRAYRKQQYRAEAKFRDIVLNGTFAEGTVQSFNMTPIGQGLNASSRIGNQVFVKHVYTKMQVVNTGNSGGVLRLVYVRDNRAINGGTIPAYSDIYTATETQAFLNPANIGRFTILMDRHIRVNPQADGASIQKYIAMFKRINRTVRWADSTEANVNKNPIYLYCLWQNDDPVDVQDLVFRMQRRCKYIDA
jgi:hypothetical protein